MLSALAAPPLGVPAKNLTALTPLRLEAVSFLGCAALERVVQQLVPREGALVENPYSRAAP